MSPLRVLVVGHGYLGSALSVALRHEGGALVAAMHRGTAEDGAYPLRSGDVSDLASLRRLSADLPFAEPDFIVHCASSSRGGAETYRQVFVEGIANLRAVFGGIPILFTSSTSVYGQTDGSLVEESSEARPDRETGRLLLEAEALAREGGGAALRLAGIYGPGRSVHLRRLLEGSATIEEAEPSRFLNQIHRDDAVSAILHLVGLGEGFPAGNTFNVVDDTPISQRQLYEVLADRFGLPRPPLAPPDPDRKRGWTHKLVSNAALRATGWAPRYPSFLDAVEHDARLVPSIREAIAAAAV
jgi:nucleoside-diphosphate-sugar epimerase